MVRIGSLAIDPPLILAPMAGVTDRDFRLLVRRIGGVGLVTMEFLSSKGLVEGDPHVERILHFSEEERPISIQIYGSDPDTMAEAARRVEAMGADACDINMGCPANRVLRGCAGARLMGDLALAERILHQVRRAVSIPLTVKFRLGLDERRLSYQELGRLCQDQGVDAVAMHGRTARQMYRGPVDRAALYRLKSCLSIPVLANGDVREPDDAVSLLAETGCDGVLVGRGATRNPWIFRQIEARLSGGRVCAPTLEDRRRLILEHFRTVAEREEPAFALHKLRLFTRWYSQGLPRGQELRRRIGGFRSVDGFLEGVEAHFQDLLAEQAA